MQTGRHPKMQLAENLPRSERAAVDVRDDQGLGERRQQLLVLD